VVVNAGRDGEGGGRKSWKRKERDPKNKGQYIGISEKFPLSLAKNKNELHRGIIKWNIDFLAKPSLILKLLRYPIRTASLLSFPSKEGDGNMTKRRIEDNITKTGSESVTVTHSSLYRMSMLIFFCT